MKKIIFIKNNSILSSLDGVDKILIEFAKHNFNSKLYEFIFLFNVKCKCSEYISRYSKVKIIGFPDPSIKSFLKRIKEFIRICLYLYFQKPSVVVGLSPFHNLFTFFIKKNSFIINYFHALDYKQNRNLRKLKVGRFIKEKLFFNFIGNDLLILNNRITKEFFIKDGFREENISILKNGFPINANYKDYKLTKSINKKKIKVIGIGRLNLRKGGKDFCEFAKYINNDKYKFTYLGVIKNPKDIQFYKNLEEYVRLPGHVDNIYDYLLDSDIGIHFSHQETGCLVVREMMSVGLPVIAWDIPTLRDDLEHQSDLLIPIGNFQEAKNKLFYLSDNFDMRKEIGLKNIDLSKRYTSKDMYYKFIEILSKANKKN